MKTKHETIRLLIALGAIEAAAKLLAEVEAKP